jgi:hypothetical protein
MATSSLPSSVGSSIPSSSLTPSPSASLPAPPSTPVDPYAHVRYMYPDYLCISIPFPGSETQRTILPFKPFSIPMDLDKVKSRSDPMLYVPFQYAVLDAVYRELDSSKAKVKSKSSSTSLKLDTIGNQYSEKQSTKIEEMGLTIKLSPNTNTIINNPPFNDIGKPISNILTEKDPKEKVKQFTLDTMRDLIWNFSNDINNTVKGGGGNGDEKKEKKTKET